MKKVALQSSQNLKKKRRCFFIYSITRQWQAALARRKKNPEQKICPNVLKTYQLISATQNMHLRGQMILRCTLIFSLFLLIIFIVNNGNIWTSGRRSKNKLKIEM